MLRGWLHKLLSMFRQSRLDAELDEEIRIHLEMATEHYVREGMTLEEARLAARRSFGGVDQVKQRHRDVRRFGWLEDIRQDGRLAIRAFVRDRGFAGVIVLTLAVAIGTSTAIFSVVEGVLIRPLGYSSEDRIVRVRAGAQPAVRRDDQGALFSPAGYRHFAENNQVFEAVGGVDPRLFEVALTGDGPPLQINLVRQAASMFELLGVSPLRGRLYTGDEDVPGGPEVALISTGLWRDRYGSDPSVVGQVLDLNGIGRELIGIMPPGFDFPSPDVDVWIPLRLDPASEVFGTHFIDIFGRLAPGSTAASATTDAEGLISRFGEVGYGPEWFANAFDGRAFVRPIKDTIVGSSRRPLLILLGSVGFVLLIACTNVANLMLVRAEGRARERAIRLTLGAGPGRLIQQGITESALLAVLGGAGGVVLALLATRSLVSLAPASVPRLGAIGVNGSVLLFATIVTVLCGLLFGVVPSLRTGSRGPVDVLKDGGRGTSVGSERLRVRNILVVSQVALTLVLLVGSGLMVRSFQNLRAVDPGFRADGVLTFGLRPVTTKYDGPEGVVRLYDQLVERLGGVPGVSAVGGIETLPMTESGRFVARVVEEFPVDEGELLPVFYVRRVTPGYFEAMSIPVLEGRVFSSDDHNLRLGTVVISRSLKERFWPETSPLGKRISGSTIVGVVGDVHGRSLDSEIEEFVYYPMLDSVGGGVTAMKMVLRADTDPVGIVPEVRRVVEQLDPDLPVTDLVPMSEILGDSLNRTTFTMTMLLLAAGIAIFLASVGIYGVIAYVVSHRTSEIGMRLALGADPTHVLGVVLSQGMKLAVVGAAGGLVAAIGLSGVLANLLYEISPLDPVILLGGPVFVLVTSGVASLIPARKAARTSPSEALRGA